MSNLPPGIVAYLIPLVVLRAKPASLAFVIGGTALVCAGTVLLLWCVREFHARGRGTLAPWDPPVRLVRTGLYQRSRNPMYVAVLLIVVGWAVSFASTDCGREATACRHMGRASRRPSPRHWRRHEAYGWR